MYQTERYLPQIIIPKQSLLYRNRTTLNLLTADIFRESTIQKLKEPKMYRNVESYLRFQELSKYETFTYHNEIRHMDSLYMILQHGDSEHLNTINAKYWVKQVYKKRKKAILKYLGTDIYELLVQINKYLKYLGDYSITNGYRLYLYIELGSSLDWFMTDIVECEYHKKKEFRSLIVSNIKLNNDLIALSGAINILSTTQLIKLYLETNNSDITDALQIHLSLFDNLLSTSHDIIKLANLEKQNKINVKQLKQNNIDLEIEQNEIQRIKSMHEISITRKIHDIGSR